MNFTTFKVIVNLVSIVSVCAGAAAVVKVWSNKSELGKKAKAQLKEDLKNRS